MEAYLSTLKMAGAVGIEPTRKVLETSMLTVKHQTPIILLKMVDQVGVEPTFIQLCTYRLEGVANTDPY